MSRIRELLTDQLDELESRNALADDPEELHKVRVATRRSRAIVRATRPLLGGALAPVADELRWLAGLLGPVRDLDVLIAHLRVEAESLDEDRAGAESIVSAFESERETSMAALEAALASERYQTLLVSFRVAVAALPERPEDLRPVATKALRRLDKAARELPGDPTDQELHKLRIRAKRARYTTELVGGKGSERLVKRLKRLQDVIGEHQDAVVAEERLRRVARAKSAVAAGRLIERQRVKR